MQKQKHFNLRKLWLSLLLLVGATAIAVPGIQEVMAGNVAKVGDTEYATIEEAIAAWGPGKTLTLLADVTTTSTVEVEVNATKSTQGWTLNLGDYTWTANGCNAIHLFADGGTPINQNYGLKINANQSGGITASGKYAVYYTNQGTCSDSRGYRPRLEINGGTYNASFIVFYGTSAYSSTANGASVFINKSSDGTEPIFNGNFGLSKCPVTVNAGYFNGTRFTVYRVSSTVDPCIYGGHFKTYSAFPVPGNDKGIVFGNYKVLVKADASIDMTNGAPAAYEAKATKTLLLSTNQGKQYNDYIFYEKANDAIQKYSSGTIDIILAANVTATQDKTLSSSGTLTIDATAEGSSYTGNAVLANNSAKLVMKFPEGGGHYGVSVNSGTLHVEESVADGIVTRTYSRIATISDPEAKVGDTSYSTVYDAFYAIDGSTENKTIILQKDVTNAGIITNGTATGGDGKTIATFDLNGKSIGIGSVAAGNNADYTLTIIDSSEEKTGTVTNSDASLFILALTGISDYSGSYTLKVQAGTWQFDPSSVNINGETRNLVDEGYVARDNGNGTWTVVETTRVAQIGTTKYSTLQATVDAAQQMGGAVTVNIIDDISGETVTIPEIANFKLTIDGKKDDNSNYTVDAIIVVDGKRGNGGSNDNGASVTLQNIDFVNGDYITAQNAAVIQPSHYPHHLTIQDCSYTGKDTDASRGNWFMDVVDGPLYGATVKNVTVEHSRLIQGNFGLDVVFENIIATNDAYCGFNIKTEGTVLIKDCQVTTAKYALRDYKDSYVGTITLEGNTFVSTTTESDEGVIVNRGGVVGTTHINVESGTYTGHVKVLNNKEGVLAISGGYFSEEFPQEYIASDLVAQGKVCSPATDMEGYFTVGDPHYVAKIGETKYVSLAAAVAEAQAGDVITMIDDDNVSLTTAGSEITINKPLTITGAVDENGKPLYTIYGSSNGALSNSSFNDLFLSCSTGTVTISNLKFDGFGNETTSVMGHSPIFIGSSNNNAIVENVYISNLNCEGIHINGGTFTIKDCNIDCSKTTNSIFTKGICVVNNAQGSIENTTITGVDCDDPNDTSAAIELQGSGTIAISDCSIQSNTIGIATTPVQNLTAGTSQVTISNCTVESQNIAVYSNGDKGALTSIQSGQYSGLLMAGDNDKGLSISGGIFDDMPELAYCAEGMIPTANTDESTSATYPYTVKVGSYVAEIDGDMYETLEAAFSAATDGSTIKLLADCAGNGIKVPQGKYTTGLTVDFDGHIYTMDGSMVGSTGTETQAFQLLKDNTITFKNGTITSTKAKILVQNYSNLTLEGMTLTLDNPDYASAYTLSNNNGNVVIDGTTINANPAGGFAFDVCRYSSYPSVSVTVKGESVINGDVEVSASGNDAKDGFSLMLESGTINGNIVVDASARAAIEATPDKAVIKENDSFNQAAPAGFKWVSNNDETSTLTPMPYVAQIGDVKYWSLADAVAAVPADGTETTITMIDNEMINVVGYAITIPATKNIVLDLNGYQVVGTVEQEGTSALIRNLGTLTIKDSSDTNKDGTGTGKLMSGANTTWTWDGTDNYAGSYASNLIRNEKNLTVESGYLYNMSTGSAAYAIDNYSAGNVTINGGKLDAAKASAIRMFYVNGGSITVNDGIVGSSTAYMGVQVMGGTNVNVSINGGTISGTYSVYSNATGGSTSITGGTYDGYVGFAASVPNISITDGIFGAWVGTWGDQTKFISGGIYADEVDEEYIADGCILTKNTDPATKDAYPYVVKQGKFVCAIGTTKYESLEEAWNAVQDGETITLLDNCAGNGIKAPQGKFTEGVTIDFGGFTYTMDGTMVGSTGTETQAFQLLKDNTITFKNGTIYSEKAKMLVQNYCNLTLENMTLTLNNENYASAYTLSNNNGSVVIDGTTINANPAGSTAFDVCRYSSYTSVNVTVKGDSKINGDIEFDAGSGDPKDGANLTIEGGTITGNLRLTSGGSTALTGHSDKATVTKSDAVELAAPADFKWVSNGDGTSTLKPCEYVAQIEGGAKYESLEAAFAAAQDGETITLLANTSGNGIKAPQGKFTNGVTVDFAGFTYTMDGATVGSTGTETQAFQLLKDNKITFKNGTIYSEKALMLVQNYSDLTLEGMTLTLNNANYASAYTLSNNNGNVVIDGTTINANPAGGFAFDVCRYSSYPSVNVTVTGNSKINGDVEVSASGSDAKDGFELMFESATLNGEIVLDASAKIAMANTPDKAKVSKSNALTDIAAPADYKWKDNGDETSTLKPCEYICAIGTTKYETLADAVAAAGTSATTITLLTEAATDGVISGDGVVVPSGSNITFDLNGLTYNVSGETVGSSGTKTSGFQLLQGSDITFKNGTLKATSPTAQMLIQNYSNLTLEDVNLDGTALSGWAYALSNNCGTINLTGSTSITAKSGGRAFDTCKFGSYAIPTVNINTTGAITGPIEATGGKLNIENGKFNVTWVTDNNYAAGDIQIKGGVFSAEPAEEYCAKGYVATDNEDEATKAEYPFAVMTKEDAGIFELIDGKVYPYLDYTEDKPAASVTYKRNFANYNWQALFIPFDINDVTKLTDKYEFAKVHMVALENDGTFTTGNKIEIYYTRVTSGKLSANQPYLIKLKNEAEQGWQDIVVENTILKDTHNMTPRKTSTMAADYYFTGTYEGYVGEKYHDFMAMGSGTINWGNTGHKLGTYRWYIKTVPFNDDYAKTTISFIEADEDATSISAANADENTEIEGYYSVNGVRSDVPVKGMNIVKYKNGKTKKIMIK